jgi:hypothetical protein
MPSIIVVVEAFANTFTNSLKEFGARYKRIVSFAEGHMAPIVCMSIVFSMVAASLGFG